MGSVVSLRRGGVRAGEPQAGGAERDRGGFPEGWGGGRLPSRPCLTESSHCRVAQSSRRGKRKQVSTAGSLQWNQHLFLLRLSAAGLYPRGVVLRMGEGEEGLQRNAARAKLWIMSNLVEKCSLVQVKEP